MAAVEKLVTDHLDLWTAAIKRRSTAGRGSSRKVELYGIKKLRELILELAVRGLLVQQDPKDEPASELLKKIGAEKARLVKEGKIKKDKPLPAISEKEKPFAAPNGWEWVRVGAIGYDFGQKNPDTSFTYIDVGAIDNRLGLIDSPSILSANEAPSRARKLVKNGTVIYSTVRPYLLNIAIVQKDFVPEPIASTAFAVVHPFENVSSGYIYRYLRSPSFVSYVESVQTGIAYPAINDRQFFNGLLPLPPTDEQHRIVAKVDELMAFCDLLEQQTDASLSAHQTLVETLLNALTSVTDHAQFVSAWQRIADYFDILFTSEESIDQLKQTILHLAVMGKLVPQDPKDEPASELLQKIAAEKAKLTKDGKIKKEKPRAPISEIEKPFDLPKGWAWAQFGSFGDTNIGLTYKPSNVGNSGIPVLRSSNVQKGTIDLSDLVRVADIEIKKSAMLAIGDLLICARNGSKALVGKTAQIKTLAEPMCFGAFMAIFRSSLNNYIEIFLNSPVFRKTLDGIDTTTINQLTQANLISTLAPIPPLTEQHRIVAKVDELMVLCNQFKSRLINAQTTQLELADALTEKALART